MPGANLKSLSRHRAKQLFWKYMGSEVESNRKYNRLGRRRKGKFPTLCWCNGEPLDGNPLYTPDFVGQICIDILNKDVYYCEFWPGGAATAFWKKISD